MRVGLHSSIVREDAVCRRLMTVPGVGPVVAVTFKSAEDDPSRIAKSEGGRSAVRAHTEEVHVHETQAGRTKAPTARSPVAGTVDAVKPLHAPWPSSDEPRVFR
jgi:hypothetical protein